MNVLRTFLMTLFVYLLLPVSTFGQQWKPLDPADIALKAPVVEKDADAEVLLWEVYKNDADNKDNTAFTHLIRIKIFTAKGKESLSRVDIPYFSRMSIKDVSGRVIKPDGTIVELKKDSVFDREIVKIGKRKLKVKTIAIPALEPGAIIEYKYRETYEFITNYSKLYFQRDIPVQVVRYFLKPHPLVEDPMQTIAFNQARSSFERAPNGYFKTERTNIPAFKEEEYMPPEDQLRAWMLVYYAPNMSDKPDSWWKKTGKTEFTKHNNLMKVNDDVRKAAAEVVGDATTPEQKLERIFGYCKTKIKDIDDDASEITKDQKEKMEKNRSPSDTLKRGYGNGGDINYLFAAMTTAAGFEARMIMLSDRSRIFFDPAFTDLYFIDSVSVAIKIDDQWKFFDPANKYVPYGMLRWQEEGIQALLCDSKTPLLVSTPVSPPEKSIKQRIAKLKLNEDGDISGDITVNYTGHNAVEIKEDYDDETPEKREEMLRDAIKARLSTATVSDIRIENITDTIKPASYSYKVNVSGYAERTGKRLFLQPAFFQKGLAAVFTASQRSHDIYFNYPWSEDDHIEIELPPGYTLDNADAPAGFDLGKTAKYDIKLRITKDNKILIYKRQLMINGLLFPKNMYEDFKKIFDHIHKQDNHAITLKQVISN